MSAHAASLATSIASAVKRLGLPKLMEREIKHRAKLEASKLCEAQVARAAERIVLDRLRAEEMTTAEVRALLRWSRRTFERRRREPGFPVARVMPGGGLRFKRAELEVWRAARPTDPKTEGREPDSLK